MSAIGIIAEALRILDTNSVPLDKIVIQKFIYFLKTQGLPIKYKFKPYTYGPFSSGLYRELDDLVFWDNLECDDNRYKILDMDEYNLDPVGSKRMQEAFSLFEKIANKDYSFQNMELIGTVLYCSQSIKEAGEAVTLENVKKEFKEWKENKYNNWQIEKAYNALNQ